MDVSKISDNNEGAELVRKGNEWEVVALTESAYAAAPGPKDISQSNLIEDDSTETAHALLMSGHFGFIPSTDENQQVQPQNQEKSFGKIHDHDVSQVIGQQGSKPDLKHEEDLHIKELIADEFSGVPQSDKKDDNMSFFSSGLGDVAPSNFIEKEQSIYSTVKVVSYDDKADESIEVAEPFESPERSVNTGTSNVQKHIEEDKSNELPNMPCEAWWRRHATSLYGHVKNANPFWSYFVVAAVVGCVIIGRRWNRDKPQIFQVKPLLVIDDNKESGWVLGPMSRLKYAALGGQHSSYNSVSPTV